MVGVVVGPVAVDLSLCWAGPVLEWRRAAMCLGRAEPSVTDTFPDTEFLLCVWPIPNVVKLKYWGVF